MFEMRRRQLIIKEYSLIQGWIEMLSADFLRKRLIRLIKCFVSTCATGFLRLQLPDRLSPFLIFCRVSVLVVFTIAISHSQGLAHNCHPAERQPLDWDSAENDSRGNSGSDR